MIICRNPQPHHRAEWPDLPAYFPVLPGQSQRLFWLLRTGYWGRRQGGGARVRDPRRTPGKTMLENSFPPPPPSGGGGSWSRAPEWERMSSCCPRGAGLARFNMEIAADHDFNHWSSKPPVAPKHRKPPRAPAPPHTWDTTHVRPGGCAGAGFPACPHPAPAPFAGR